MEVEEGVKGKLLEGEEGKFGGVEVGGEKGAKLSVGGEKGFAVTGGDANFGGGVSVEGEVSVLGEGGISAKTVSVEGVIKGQGSLEVEGSLKAADFKVGVGEIDGGLQVGRIQAAGDVSAESFTCGGLMTTSNGLVVQSGEVTVTGPISATETVSGKEGTFEGVVKSQSLMTSRVYTDDFTASGFVSAGVVRVKGDVESLGTVKGKVIEGEDTVKGMNVEAENKVKAVVGEFGGS